MSSKTDGPVMRIEHDEVVHVEWKIPNFFHQPPEEIYSFLRSSEFLFSDARWFIRICPNLGKYVYLDLTKEKSPKDLHVSATIGIKKGDNSVFKSFYTSWIFKKEQSTWWLREFLSSELFQSKDLVAPNGELTIFVTARRKDCSPKSVALEAACQTRPYGFGTLSYDFQKLFCSQGESDVTFKVKDRNFSAHKMVLSSRSTVFRAMFETNMVEKNNGVVDISDSDEVHFEKLLLYLYSGDLNVVSPCNASGLYYLADKYNLQELKKTCCKSMASYISVDSFWEVLQLAYLHNETELMQTSFDFFIKHDDVIFRTPAWASLMAEQSTLGNELLAKMNEMNCSLSDLKI